MNFDLKETVKSGIVSIDEILGDGFSIGLHEISGMSGTAKTAFLLQMACKTNFPVIYLNTEMNERDVLKRFVAISTKININDINQLSAEDREKYLALTKSNISNITVEDGNSGFISVNYLTEKIKTLAANSPETIVLIIDSFNEWVETAKDQFPNMSVKDLRAMLRSQLIDISKGYNLTVFTSAQEKGSDKDLIEELEFASNTHIVLSWEKSGRPDSEGFKYVKFFFKKNRGGVSGGNKIVKFRGEIQEFS